MVRYVVALAVVVLGAVAGILPAEARRVALVIGNTEYKIGRLANPVNDAAAVAEALEKQLKFDTVLLRPNLTLDGFRAALREMASVSRGAEMGVIFFAGHGIEVGGRNFLIPTDAALAAARDIELEAVALDTVLGQLDGVTKLRLVILDACRNNPFSIAGAKRSVTRGLARIEPDGGTLVAYAAKDGTTADDGKGRHSPFTAALLKRIVMPGVDVRLVFGHVSDDVLAATNRVQEPFLYGRLGGTEVYLNPPVLKGPAPVHAAGPQPAVTQSSEAERAWAAVKDSTSIGQLEVIVGRYKGTVYADLAQARVAELRKQQTALASPPVAVAPPASAPKPDPAVGVFHPSRKAVPLTPAEERALKPKDSFKECADCPEMVVVPAGSFMMGSPASEAGRNTDEGPQHRVTIARPFAVGKFEVTFAEWDACVAGGGCLHTPHDGWPFFAMVTDPDLGRRVREGTAWIRKSSDPPTWGRGQRPAIDVSWSDITSQYLPWLSRKTGRAYRLLSEAEWEYAARAGTASRYTFGEAISTKHAWYFEGRSSTRTAEVGSFPANRFGLNDMHGNVSEWVWDCWNANYIGAPSDGSAWSAGDCGSRIMRGGGWSSAPDFLRSAARKTEPPTVRNYATGFRVATNLSR